MNNANDAKRFSRLSRGASAGGIFSLWKFVFFHCAVDVVQHRHSHGFCPYTDRRVERGKFPHMSFVICHLLLPDGVCKFFSAGQGLQPRPQRLQFKSGW